MVNWPLPIFTTADGDVGIIFSVAEVISELMSKIGSFDGEPLVDGFEWANGEGFAIGLELLPNSADIPWRFAILMYSVKRAANSLGSLDCDMRAWTSAGFLYMLMTAAIAVGSNWLKGCELS